MISYVLQEFFPPYAVSGAEDTATQQSWQPLVWTGNTALKSWLLAEGNQ